MNQSLHQEAKFLYNRQKTLIGLLKVFGGHLSNTDFQKYLFLFTQEFEKKPSFEFVPYHFGGFSFQSYADKRHLIEIGALLNDDHWQLQNAFFVKNDLFHEEAFRRFYAKYSSLKGKPLVQNVYRRYPYYAIKSEIADQYMNAQEMNAIKAKHPTDNDPCFFTIGYEGASIDNYLNRLIKNNVKLLVDVRRNPISRKYGFSKKTLSDMLKKVGINYIHSPELGIASEKRNNLKTQEDYDRLFDAYENEELKHNFNALQNLFALFLQNKRIAITCFEAQVCQCHRGRIAKTMTSFPNWHYNIKHL